MISGNIEIFGLVSHIQIEFCIIKIVAFFLQGNTVFAFEKDTKKKSIQAVNNQLINSTVQSPILSYGN